MPDPPLTDTRSRPLDAAAFVFNRQFHFIRSSSPDIRNIRKSRFDKNKILLRITETNPIHLNDSFFTPLNSARFINQPFRTGDSSRRFTQKIAAEFGMIHEALATSQEIFHSIRTLKSQIEILNEFIYSTPNPDVTK
ncbi:hypothetical protein [Burkholderia cepacia]|uniref:hypothetical protein n=1 Tax=Burkholderia cepacia TaxID=292 RepID=UPI002AB1DB97|nr:hypothetical protein [Burkholderia cepacia]